MLQLKQQVNFYRDEFKKPEIILPAKQMVQIAAIVLAGFFIVGGYQVWSLQALENKIAKQVGQRDRLNNQYDSLMADFVEPTEDPALLNQLNTLNDEAKQKQKLRDFLLRESGKSLFSFAAVLDDLARNDVANIWLTQVTITTTGNQYRLKGITQHADAIPEYIEALKQAEALQGTSFSVFSMERDADREAFLHFTLSSEQDDEASEG